MTAFGVSDVEPSVILPVSLLAHEDSQYKFHCKKKHASEHDLTLIATGDLVSTL